jgi:hypothetical protein
MINQETVIMTVVLAILTLVISRKYLLLPFIVAACFIPHDQRIIFLGLDFTPLRLLVVFGVLRMLLRGEQRRIRWNLFDRMLFAWAICGAVVYIIQWADFRSLAYWVILAVSAEYSVMDCCSPCVQGVRSMHISYVTICSIRVGNGSESVYNTGKGPYCGA